MMSSQRILVDRGPGRKRRSSSSNSSSSSSLFLQQEPESQGSKASERNRVFSSLSAVFGLSTPSLILTGYRVSLYVYDRTALLGRARQGRQKDRRQGETERSQMEKKNEKKMRGCVRGHRAGGTKTGDRLTRGASYNMANGGEWAGNWGSMRGDYPTEGLPTPLGGSPGPGPGSLYGWCCAVGDGVFRSVCVCVVRQAILKN